MDKNIQKKVIDITGIELTPEEPTVCLGNGGKALSVVATSATTVCFVFPNWIKKQNERGHASPTRITVYMSPRFFVKAPQRHF